MDIDERQSTKNSGMKYHGSVPRNNPTTGQGARNKSVISNACNWSEEIYPRLSPRGTLLCFCREWRSNRSEIGIFISKSIKMQADGMPRE
jgi:hypothetical protein